MLTCIAIGIFASIPVFLYLGRAKTKKYNQKMKKLRDAREEAEKPSKSENLYGFMSGYLGGYKAPDPYADMDERWYISLEFTALCAGLSLAIVIFFIGVLVLPTEASGRDTIEYLTQYNAEIETEINTLVLSYMDYEKESFTKETSPTLLLEAYPELKASELIYTQIKIFTDNREEIRNIELRLIKNKFWTNLIIPW